MQLESRLIRLSLLLAVLLCLPSTQATAGENHAVVATSVGAIGFTVLEMDRSVSFYRDVLTFKPISDVEVDGPEYDRLWGIFGVRARVVRMQLGEQQLELIEFLSPPDVRPIPVPSYSNDLWFQHFAIVVRDMEAAWAQLRKHHVRQISPRPQTIPVSNAAAAGIKAIKFRDPDGHNLELLWFPEGKGSPKWHRSGTDVFLGIDHTAMTVRSTESSIKFSQVWGGIPCAGNTLKGGAGKENRTICPGPRGRGKGTNPQTAQ